MSHTYVTDSRLAVIRLLLSPPEKTGRPRADDRKTLYGILYVLRSYCR